jgi:hypothetical protein
MAVRVLGNQALSPVLLTQDEAITPEAMSQPIYFDFGGNGWESPCNTSPAICTQ